MIDSKKGTNKSSALNLLSGAPQEIEDHSGHERDRFRGDCHDRDRSGWAERASVQMTVIVTVIGGERGGWTTIQYKRPLHTILVSN